MASDNCIYCGAQILSTAVTCPKCRKKVHRKTSMASWIGSAIVIVIIFIASQFLTTKNPVENKSTNNQNSNTQ